MNKQEKKKIIFADITKNYDEFLRQANMKLDRRFRDSDTDHIEVVSYVLHSIVDKFDSEDCVERFYQMVRINMLFNYIVKSINTQCKSLRAPYLMEKLRVRNRGYVPYNLTEDESEDTDLHNKELVEIIYDSFEIDKAPKIYGPDWQYYITIFRDYIETPKSSFNKLALKYNIPMSSIYRDIKYIKNKIKTYLKDEDYI